MKTFVYGSLKRGCRNHHVLTGATYLGDTMMTGLDLYDLGAFPGAVRGTGSVSGELYEVDHRVLARLDRLEGHPDFYRRIPRHVQGLTETVWVYVLRRDQVAKCEQLPSGVWVQTDVQGSDEDEDVSYV